MLFIENVWMGLLCGMWRKNCISKFIKEVLFLSNVDVGLLLEWLMIKEIRD